MFFDNILGYIQICRLYICSVLVNKCHGISALPNYNPLLFIFTFAIIHLPIYLIALVYLYTNTSQSHPFLILTKMCLQLTCYYNLNLILNLTPRNVPIYLIQISIERRPTYIYIYLPTHLSLIHSLPRYLPPSLPHSMVHIFTHPFTLVWRELESSANEGVIFREGWKLIWGLR